MVTLQEPNIGPLHEVEPPVHQWIANEAYKYFQDQIDESSIPSSDRISNHLGVWTIITGQGKTKLIEGTWAEDQEAYNDEAPWGSDYYLTPWVDHYCAGGDGDQLFDGLGPWNSALVRANWYWVNYAKPKYTLDKAKAYYYLGHVAHLLTDMCVPAHTHNDEHPQIGGVGDYDYFEFQVGSNNNFQVHGFNKAYAGHWTDPLAVKQSLEDLFRVTVNYTEDYPSFGGIEGEPGEPSNERYYPLDYTYTDHHPENVSGSGLYTANQCSWDEYLTMSKDLMPHAIRRVADLYRLWYKEVDDPYNGGSRPSVSMTYPTSEDVQNPTIRTSKAAFNLTASASDPQSGILKKGFQFKWKYWNGSAWVPESSWYDASPSPTTSSVSFTPRQDSTEYYAFYVIGENGGGWTNNSSVTYLRILPGGSNDNFANAYSISGNSGQTTGSNVGATKESGEPSHAGNSGGASVWWQWTAPASGQVTIDTFGSNFDTLLAVYTGSSVGNLTERAANDDAGGGNQSQVIFNATSGTTYRIAVDGFNGATGNITLSFDSLPSEKYRYGGSVTCQDVGPKPYPAINPTTTFYSDDPDHMCIRIELNDVYKNLDYSPLIKVKCEFTAPDGVPSSPMTWNPVKDPRLNDPPYDWWTYYICYSSPGIMKTYGLFSKPGHWTYKIFIDEENGYQQVDEGYFDTIIAFRSISGYVRTSGGSGISGVSVSANNGGGSSITDSSGYYSIPVAYGWSGTATPSKTGYNFSPLTRNYSNITSNQSGQDYTGTGTVATPTFSPDGSTYTSPVDVTISCATSGATIHYTTNGVDPTESDPVYSSPINISTTTTLKAKAWKTGWNPSVVKSADYTITGTVATPTFSPDGGTYTSPVDVTINCTTPDAIIHYTTNGVDPTESDTIVAPGGTVFVDHSLTLKAKAWKSGWNPSNTATATYFIIPIYAAGEIVAWGYNGDGQCTVPSPNTGFTAIAASRYHSLGLKQDGSIVAWGSNASGQCTVPSPNTGFTAIAGGGNHSLGLKADGSIVAWGYNGDGQCTLPSPNTGFTAIAAGGYHSLGLKADGSIVAWGWSYYGQCTVPPPNTGFTAISAGWYHSLGLKQDGSIVAWGANGSGQCTVPSPNTGFTAIAAGGHYPRHHSLGLKQDGSIVAWGDNGDGQCTVPSPNTGFTAIAAGGWHSLGLKQDGSIVAWGDNGDGQCTVPSPNTGFTAIAAGGWHSLGLKAICLYVDANSPNDPGTGTQDDPFRKIQYGIDAAGDGTKVIVAQGKYFENININGKNIILRSTDPNDPNVVAATIIDGNNLGSVVTIMGANVAIAGFTITNGFAVANGGGIYCSGGNTSITNCNIRNNTSSRDGAGIYCTGASLEIRRCIISNNININTNVGNWGTKGAGICCFYSCSVINGCTIKANTGAYEGGGIYSHDCPPRISNCVIAGNSASSGGGGIYISGSEGTVSHCLISGNSATYGGGICIWSYDRTVISNCTIVGNGAGWEGGGICFWLGCFYDKEIQNCILWDNGAAWEGAQIGQGTNEFGDYVTVAYSNIKGGWPGGGNIDADPYFADQNNGDFHLKSEFGRWDPGLQFWVYDSITSPCIDAGDPNSDWTAELWPHGKRINMGAYGGTPEASMSRYDVGNVADLNRDGTVDFQDFAYLAGCWQMKNPLLAEDMDLNGEIDGLDLEIFADNWLIFEGQYLVGYWKFDDGNGTVAYDSSGYGNTGVFVSGPVWTSGKFDQALRFDGIDDAVEVKTDRLDPNAGSISLWAYAEAFTDTHHYLFGHTTSPPWNNRIQLYVNDPNGNLTLGLGDVHFRHTGIEKLDLRRWYNIVLTWNGKTYEVYVDGVLKASGSYTGLSRLAALADIGNNGSPAYRDESFCGVIDEVRIYSRVLTPIEVVKLYN